MGKKRLSKFWEKVEHYNSKLIPFALIILLLIIIFELFIHVENHTLELIFHLMDYFVVTIFVIDLIFLALHSKNTRFFFKNYWLDILAVFPFILMFDVITKFYRALVATESIVVSQAVFHETLELGKSTKVISRTGKLTQMGARLLRVFTKSHFLTKIFHHHHRHRKKKFSIKRFIKDKILI